MAENKNETPKVVTVKDESEETTPGRLQTFVNKHPRAAKIVAITGGVAAVLGTVQFARTVQANRKHLELASDHAKEALNELSTSVSPQDAEA